MKRMRAAITLDRNGHRLRPIRPGERTYRPHFVPDGSSSMLGVQFASGPESLSPGESGEVEFECIYDLSYDELRPDVRFVIMEGPHRVGVGVVLAPGP